MTLGPRGRWLLAVALGGATLALAWSVVPRALPDPSELDALRTSDRAHADAAARAHARGDRLGGLAREEAAGRSPGRSAAHAPDRPGARRPPGTVLSAGVEVPYEHAGPVIQSNADIAGLEFEAALADSQGRTEDAARVRQEIAEARRERDALRGPDASAPRR